MATNRGFHRLALLLAAIPLLVGIAISYYVARSFADGAWEAHQKAALCASVHCKQSSL